MSLFRHRRIRISGIKPQKEIAVSRKAHDIDVRVQGYDNTVRIDTDSYRGSVSVYGVGNTVIIEEGVWVCKPCSIVLGSPGCPCFNCSIIVRRGTYLGEAELMCAEDGSSIEIGEHCMFSLGIQVWCTDGHTIRREDGSLNIGKRISIGARVWVGMDVKIGKNTTIADDCMVGWGSIVTGRFEEPHCLLAGVPARVCRRGITWDERRPMKYIEDSLEKQYPDWDAAPPPCAPLRLLLRAKLAWFRYLAAHKSDMQKRRKYERKAEAAAKRLGR